MKLTYWHAAIIGDGAAYDVIAKTKKAALAQVAERHWNKYEPVVKRELIYTDAFDLFDWATSEGGGRSCGSLS